MILSKLPLHVAHAAPMLDGAAAFAEVVLPPTSGGNSLLVYSIHLSTRCPPTKRRQEVEAVLRHATVRATGGADNALANDATAGRPAPIATLVAGDFNQPNEDDYPSDEWAVLAADLDAARLPRTDGAMAAMRAAGFVPSWERPEAVARPLAASSAWNGAIVDYCFVRANGVACEHGKGSQQALHHHQHHHRHHRHGSTPGGITVEASYFYHTLASDHLPLVVDFNIVRSNSPTVQVSDEQGKLE